MDLITDQDKYIVTTSFVKPGFSGGGLFNTKRQLIGINSMSVATPVFLRDKLQPLMSHVRIDYIKEKVRDRFGEETSDTVFNCAE